MSGYREFEEFVSGLTVVNDPAERGIKLVEDFVGRTRNESLRQDLFLAISQHRKEFKSDRLDKESLKKVI